MKQWYSYDPEYGFEVYGSAKEAQEAAEASIDHYRDRASDGWHEDMLAIEWGELVCHGHAKEVDRVNREDDDTGLCERLGVDYRCDYVIENVSEKREKTLVEVFGFDKLTDEEKKENLLTNLGIAK